MGLPGSVVTSVFVVCGSGEGCIVVPSKFNVTSGLPEGRHKTIISLLTLCSLHLHNDFDRVKLHTPQSFHKKGLEKAVLASRVNI